MLRPPPWRPCSFASCTAGLTTFPTEWSLSPPSTQVRDLFETLKTARSDKGTCSNKHSAFLWYNCLCHLPSQSQQLLLPLPCQSVTLTQVLPETSAPDKVLRHPACSWPFPQSWAGSPLQSPLCTIVITWDLFGACLSYCIIVSFTITLLWNIYTNTSQRLTRQKLKISYWNALTVISLKGSKFHECKACENVCSSIICPQECIHQWDKSSLRLRGFNDGALWSLLFLSPLFLRIKRKMEGG